MTPHRMKRKRLICELCKIENKKKYDSNRYSHIREDVIENVKLYRINNREAVKETKRRYRNKNSDKIKEYFLKYRESYKPIRNAREKERLLNDPQYALKKRLRNNILAYIKGKGVKKECSSTELLGCSHSEFKQYFESKFTDGMTWEIFCSGNLIHIDHIIPVDAFNFEILDEVRKCFHYTNLQPLWKSDNLAKSNKIL